LQELQEKCDALTERLKRQRRTNSLKRKDDTLELKKEPTPPVPVMRKKERDYMGMFEYKSGDENLIIRRLIFGKTLEMRLKIFLQIVVFCRIKTQDSSHLTARVAGLHFVHVHSPH
jgi:hypothetical protein